MSSLKISGKLSDLNDIFKQFGIEDNAAWITVLLFIRNLVKDLSVFSDNDKAAIQREIFHELKSKELTSDRYMRVLAKIDAFIMRNTGTVELESALATEKRSAAALVNDMSELLKLGRNTHSSHEQRLQECGEHTVTVVESEADQSVIVAKVRQAFQELVKEFQEETKQWENRVRQLERTAMFDPLLTNLFNRRAFDGYLLRSVELAHKKDQHLSLMMLDVDHFKRVNDTYGHQVGDEVLKALAGIVTSQAVQFGGYVARYGGEEIAIVARNMNLQGGVFKAEAIRTDVERSGKVPGADWGFTISIGVAALENDMTAADFVHAADTALYKAKNSGRNRVIAFER